MIDDSQLVQQLLETGLIDRDSLREGIKLHKKHGGSLYETLVLNRLVDERRLVDVAARILNVPSVQLSRLELHRDVLDLVPGPMASRNRVIPIQLREEGGKRQLILGMADPIDVLAMDEIASHTGIDIRPVLVGPLELGQVIERSYAPPRDETDDLLAGLDNLAADMLEDSNWADFFDSAIEESASTEDSSVISQEMRDRPSTDVFEAVDDEPSIDDLMPSALNGPVDERLTTDGLADLDEWELDDAITNNHDISTNSSRAEILSAHDAESLFGPKSGLFAALEQPAASPEDDEDDEDEESDEPTKKKSVDELTDDADETGKIEKSRDRTRLGVGPADVADAAKTPEDVSSRTQAGMGAAFFDEGEKAAEPKGKKKTSKGDETSTDYGALGLQILKSTTDEEDAAEAAAADDGPELDTGTLDEAKTSIHRGAKHAPAPDPATREVAEKDLVELTAEGAVAERAASSSGFEVPRGLETQVVLAAVKLLVDKGILDADELLTLAHQLKGS